MKIALLLSALLASSAVFAGDPAPYVVNNGRGSRQAAPAPQNSGGGVSTGGVSAQGFAAGATTGAPAARAVSGGSRHSFSFGPMASPARAFRVNNSIGSRGIGAPPTGGGSGGSSGGSGGSGGGAPEDPPPYYSKPGALIRTEGSRLPVYSDPGNAGTHSVEGGGFIGMDDRRAHNVGGTGVTRGSPDGRPSPNPNGTLAGGNTATANGPVPTGGGSGGGSHGGSHDDSSAVGTGFDPSF